ncbi:sugar O-acetyltransferase [Prevotella sp. AGR2160]|uniref:sugar O-acetyltransferase n=1 Tax=Prevotella sp. AGR2160 TaxID=1280674 RepID=UPI0003F88FF4|nr:sugar O-acetyltransferase [Prevotella sp. AGR2160]
MTPSEIMQLVTGMDGYIGDVTKIPFERIQKGRDLVWEYNRTKPSDTKRQEQLLRQILGTYHEGVVIQPGIAFDYGFNTHFRGTAFLNFGVTILDTSPVMIGTHCFIAPQVTISCASHPLDAAQRAAGIEVSRPIVIGDDVWIGANATICGDVTIGDGVVIGAGAVVLHDIPAHTVVAGVPARKIRDITPDACIPEGNIEF